MTTNTSTQAASALAHTLDTLKTIAAIRDLLEAAERVRNIYWWSPERSAAGRRSAERRLSRELIEWDEGGMHWTGKLTVTCSCSHSEAHAEYTRNGVKTTAVAVRNSLARLEKTVSD